MSKVVVFGANGFIGKHLVHKLAEDSDTKIVAFDRFPEVFVGNNSQFNDLKNVEIFPGDFLNHSDVSQALEGADYVFHLVSTTNPALSAKDPFIDIDTNVRGSIMLFELCSQKKIKRVIFPSSGGSVYGDVGSEIIDEDTIPKPLSPYGIGKITIEHYLNYFKKTKGLDYIVFRISNPYGPGQNIKGRQGVVPIFLNAALKAEPVTVYGDGSMIRDYIYIDDLIDMLVSSYKKANPSYMVYNIGSGKGTSINEVIKTINKHFRKKLAIKTQPIPPIFVNKSVLNIDRFIKEYNVHPQTNLDTGIAKTLEFLRRKG